MPLVSIIVPVFNAEKYIGDTIRSIQEQTFKDYELLLIIDGATDRSSEICENYAGNDDRISLFYQNNKGCSGARNQGLKLATGKYVLFVDHDDIINNNLISTVLDEITDSKFKMIKFGAQIFDIDERGIVVSKRKQRYKSLLYEKNKTDYLFPRIIKMEMNTYVWDAIYDRDFLISNGLFFEDDFRNGGEDIAFNIQMLNVIDSFKTIKGLLYKHYNRANQSTSLKNNSNYYEIKADLIKIFQKSLLKNNNLNCVKAYSAFVSKCIGSAINKYVRDNGNNKDEICNCMEVLFQAIEWSCIRFDMKGIRNIWSSFKLYLFKRKQFLLLMRLYMLY